MFDQHIARATTQLDSARPHTTTVTTTLDDHFLPKDVAREAARLRAETTRAVARAIFASVRKVFAPQRRPRPKIGAPQAV